jgi:hypothetical protein
MVELAHFNLGVFIMISRKNNVLMLVLFALSNSVQAGAVKEIPNNIWTINRQTVDLYKKRISEKLTRNKYERIGVLCASTAAIVALGWYTLKSPELVSADQALTKSANQKLNEMYEANQNMQRYAAIIAAKAATKNTQEPAKQKPSMMGQWGSGMWSYGTRMGQAAVDNVVLLILMGGLPGPINKLFNFWGSKLEEIGARVYHDADFHWFVTSQTQAVAYFNDLERSADLLALASDAEEREHQKVSMMWAADVLVKQLAHIVSFMEYQAEELKVLNTGCSIQMQASAKYVYRHVEQFGATLQSMLNDRTKHAEIPAYIKSFRGRLRSEQDSFCVNESAALYDVSDHIS